MQDCSLQVLCRCGFCSSFLSMRSCMRLELEASKQLTACMRAPHVSTAGHSALPWTNTNRMERKRLCSLPQCHKHKDTKNKTHVKRQQQTPPPHQHRCMPACRWPAQRTPHTCKLAATPAQWTTAAEKQTWTCHHLMLLPFDKPHKVPQGVLGTQGVPVLSLYWKPGLFHILQPQRLNRQQHIRPQM